MLVFEERGKPECPEKNLSEQSRAVELPNKATDTSPPWPAFGSPTVQLTFYCSKCDFVPCAHSKGVKIGVVTNWRSETGAENVWITATHSLTSHQSPLQ